MVKLILIYFSKDYSVDIQITRFNVKLLIAQPILLIRYKYYLGESPFNSITNEFILLKYLKIFAIMIKFYQK